MNSVRTERPERHTGRKHARGRYAPSPSGDLHLGNLRTALAAWAHARSTGSEFVLRVDDLDPERSRRSVADRQIADLRCIGLDWDGPVVWQSTRGEAYLRALQQLIAADAVYECFCTRKDIQLAGQAPHQPPGAYPGTCRNLTNKQRGDKRRSLTPGRAPALRMRSEVRQWSIDDDLHGTVTAGVDDFVLRRGDGAWAYNLAVVVDDTFQQVGHIVRGEDLLDSAPRQSYLASRLGLEEPVYAHIPLVLGPDHKRLAKRDGAVTLAQLSEGGYSTVEVVGLLTSSLGYPTARTAQELAGEFRIEAMPRAPFVFGANPLSLSQLQ